MAFWVKTTSNGSGNVTGQWYHGDGLVDAEVAGVTNDFGTSLGADRFRFGTGQPDVSITSTTSITDGVWHFCVATRDKPTGQIKIYVDGNLEGEDTGGTNSLTTPNNIRFGSLQTQIRYFQGSLDNIAIWDTTLTAEAITELYNGCLLYTSPSPRDRG